jgi:hypothetical protein
LYYFSAILTYYIPRLTGINIWIALFAMIFGAFSTGNANAFGPDVSKAKTAAEKIFAVTETASEIDVISEEKDKI